MNNKTALRYVLFYLSVIYFLSLYSYIFDFIFYKVDYGTVKNYQQNINGYILSFIILYMHLTIPLSILYNYTINNFFPHKKSLRLLAGLIVGVSIGLLIGNHGFGISFYIGEYRWLKHLLVFSLTGVSVELIRIVVIRIKYNS